MNYNEIVLISPVVLARLVYAVNIGMLSHYCYCNMYIIACQISAGKRANDLWWREEKNFRSTLRQDAGPYVVCSYVLI